MDALGGLAEAAKALHEAREFRFVLAILGKDKDQPTRRLHSRGSFRCRERTS